MIIIQLDSNQLSKLIEESVRKVLLSEKRENQPPVDKWFDVTELRNYLPDKPAESTVYEWVHFKTIPYHKGPKKLRFLKSDIDNWLKKDRVKTMNEIGIEVDEYLTKK